MITQWRQEYASGITEIDAMHRTIVERLGVLQLVSLDDRPGLSSAMADLERSVAQHFEAEERLLDTMTPAATETHRREHRHLMRLLTDGGMLCSGPRVETALPAFVRVIGRWLMHEITANDQHLFAYVRARNHGLRADL